jgi:hypothetical protein
MASSKEKEETSKKEEPVKKGIQKKSIETFTGKFKGAMAYKAQNNLDNIKEKPQEWLSFLGRSARAFDKALSTVGLPLNHITTVLGHSNTGKSLTCIEAIKAAQNQGMVVVYYDIEGAVSWKHLYDCGVKVKDNIDKETGEVTYCPGDDIIYFNTKILYDKYACYDHREQKYKPKAVRETYCIADVALSIRELTRDQRDKDWGCNIYFIIDSIGSGVTFKSAMGGVSLNYDYAGEFANAFDIIGQEIIPSGKYVDNPYSNGLLIVNKLSVSTNLQGLKVASAKGSSYAGDYMRRYTIFFGGQGSSGAKKTMMTYRGESFEVARTVKVALIKNHVTNITREGEIVFTNTGFIPVSELEDYKKEFKEILIRDLKNKGNNVSDDEFGEYTEDVTFEG